LHPNLQVPIFKIVVGWRPKNVTKVPVCFGLEGTLLVAKKNQFLVKFQSTEKKTVEQEPIVFFFWCWVSCE